MLLLIFLPLPWEATVIPNSTLGTYPQPLPGRQAFSACSLQAC